VRALPLHGAVLRQDGDAALLFEVVAVHHAFGDLLVLAEGAALAQQLVDQRGLAMVDVGDDGDVADLAGHAVLSVRRPCTSIGLSSRWISVRRRRCGRAEEGLGLGPEHAHAIGVGEFEAAAHAGQETRRIVVGRGAPPGQSASSASAAQQREHRAGLAMAASASSVTA
jgi:hypothetical protein